MHEQIDAQMTNEIASRRHVHVPKLEIFGLTAERVCGLGLIFCPFLLFLMLLTGEQDLMASEVSLKRLREGWHKTRKRRESWWSRWSKKTEVLPASALCMLLAESHRRCSKGTSSARSQITSKRLWSTLTISILRYQHQCINLNEQKTTLLVAPKSTSIAAISCLKLPKAAYFNWLFLHVYMWCTRLTIAKIALLVRVSLVEISNKSKIRITKFYFILKKN